MADLAVEDVDLTGLAPAYVAASAGGDRFDPRGSVPIIVHVKNGDGVAHTVTVDDPNTTAPPGASAFDPDVGVDVPAGGEAMFAVSDSRFKNADGWINLAYDSPTGLTVGLFRAIV